MDGRGARGGTGIDQLSLLGDVPPSRRPDRPTHVLLDLDGCLLDSREPILRSLNSALRDLGLTTITAAELEPLVGPPLQEAVAEILDRQRADAGLLAPVVDAFRTRYRTLSVELAATAPGMDAVVHRLADRFTLGVVTAKPVVLAGPILEALGLRDRFAIVAGPTLESTEPKHVTLGLALRALDVAPPHAVMVGDRRHDVAAARAHGVAAIGVTWGHGTVDELRTAGADHVVDGPDELVDLLDRLASMSR